jgi:hypothetical protein
MRESLSEQLQKHRLTVVEVLRDAGRIRVRGGGDTCSEISCGSEAIVDANEGPSGGLEALCAGDIVRIESDPGGSPRIVVVRRVWEELTSPEF